jgi:hypothetical protein
VSSSISRAKRLPGGVRSAQTLGIRTRPSSTLLAVDIDV